MFIVKLPKIPRSIHPSLFIATSLSCRLLQLEVLKDGREGGGGVKVIPLDFFSFKILFLNRLPNDLVQLFSGCSLTHLVTLIK